MSCFPKTYFGQFLAFWDAVFEHFCGWIGKSSIILDNFFLWPRRLNWHLLDFVSTLCDRPDHYPVDKNNKKNLLIYLADSITIFWTIMHGLKNCNLFSWKSISYLSLKWSLIFSETFEQGLTSIFSPSRV